MPGIGLGTDHRDMNKKWVQVRKFGRYQSTEMS